MLTTPCAISSIRPLLVILIAFFALSKNTPARETAKLHLIVSVDWEGRTLETSNLQAIKEFIREFPHLRLLHFLNAAYYTKPDANESHITEKIKNVLRKGDELGLHIHAWKTLMEQSGVPFREGPTFWGYPVGDCLYDCGNAVALFAYTKEELRKVVRFSINKLHEQGLGRATSFRAGGWVAPRKVLEALVEEGMTLDSSAVPPFLLKDEMNEAPLGEWIQTFWGDIKESSQPWVISTSGGPLWEIPDNGALADYVTADEMVILFEKAVRQFKTSPGQDIFFQIGFHQETAQKYLPRIITALKRIQEIVKEENTPFNMAPFPLQVFLERTRPLPL